MNDLLMKEMRTQLKNSLILLEILLLSLKSLGLQLVDNLYSDGNYPSFRNAEIIKSKGKFMELTKSAYYKKDTRPGYSPNKNETFTLYVNVSLDMISLQEINEIDSECTISFKMDLEWVDLRLSYETNETELISIEPYLADRIWTPQLKVPNIREPGSLELKGSSNMIILRTRSDGYVFVQLTFQLNLFCQMVFKSYPFDVQTCYIRMQSQDYNVEDVVYLWSEDPFKNSDGFQLSGFSLRGYKLVNDSTLLDLPGAERMSRITVALDLKRNWYHFLFDVYFPSALFVAMSWLSFWIEIPATPARVTLGMTTMLTLVTSNIFSRDRLPRVSYVHPLDIWIASCICFVFLSLIEYTFVSYLYSTDKSKRDRQKSLQKNISALSLASLASNSISQYLNEPELEKQRLCQTIPELAAKLRRLSDESSFGSDCTHDLEVSHYSVQRKSLSLLSLIHQIKCPNQELAKNIDKKCRLIFPICFAIFNIIYWTSYDL